MIKYFGSEAPEFHKVQFEVSMLLRDKIIVGHSLWHFLSVSAVLGT